MYKSAKKGNKIVDPIFAYINDVETNTNKVSQATTAEEMCTIEWIIEALEVNASQAIKEISNLTESSNASKKQIENDLYALELIKMAKAHLLAVTLNIYKHHHPEPKCDEVKAILQNLGVLYGL